MNEKGVECGSPGMNGIKRKKKLKTIIEYNRMIKSESIIKITKIEQDNIIKLNDV
jgi:hypothetical protein